MSKPKYDCAAHPSTIVDPGRGSPLDCNNLYILSVYDQAVVPDDEYSGGAYDKSGWVSVGLARFCSEDHSFHVADHKISTVNWNQTLYSLSWSDAYGGTGRVPGGSLNFSDDLRSFLGMVTTSDGKERTVSGLIITGYHTRRARQDGVAFDSYDFFYGAVRNAWGSPELQPLCQFWDPDNYDDDDGHGFTYDVSTDARFAGGIGSNFVKRPGSGEYAYVSFDIAFSEDLKDFRGIFSNDNEETIFTWTGTSFDIPANIRGYIEDRLQENSLVRAEARKELTHAKQERALGRPSFALGSYLPVALLDIPPPYTRGAFPNVATQDPGMSELKLWQISSLQTARDPNSGEMIVTDIVQGSVGKASQIYPYLDEDEKAILRKNAEFNNAASIPFFAQALRSSAVATPAQKEEINETKINAWFTAMSSLDPPKDGTPDPVIVAGLEGNEYLKKLQTAYSAQMDELYRHYYRLKVADFSKYCSDQQTAQEWFDRFKMYLESPEFGAQWASLNSDINFKDGSRNIMEASVKLNVLEDIGYPLRALEDRQTPEIVNTLACQAALASFSTSVKFDPTLEKTLEDLIKDVGDMTEEEVREKYANMLEAYTALQTLLLAYGGTRAFTDWMIKIMRHYGAGGKEGFSSLMQLAGDQITAIWNKLTKGKSRYEVIAEFGKEIVEIAEEPMQDAVKWPRIQAAWGQFKGGAKTFFSHMALVACAAGLIAVAAGHWGVVDTTVRVYLGLEAFAYALRGLKLFASTALGRLIKTRLLDNKAFLQRVGEWFSEQGLPKEISATSILGRLVGKNIQVFLERFGAVLSVAMVVVCAFDFKNALESGNPTDIAETAVYLILAIIDVAVVATGIIANLAGASAVAACAGPIGLAFALIGLVVAVVFFIIKLVNPEPPPDPVQGFINDELAKAGSKTR